MLLSFLQSASTTATAPTTRSKTTTTTKMTMVWTMKRRGPVAGGGTARGRGGRVGGAVSGTTMLTLSRRSTGCRRPNRSYASYKSWLPWCRYMQTHRQTDSTYTQTYRQTDMQYLHTDIQIKSRHCSKSPKVAIVQVNLQDEEIKVNTQL